MLKRGFLSYRKSTFPILSKRPGELPHFSSTKNRSRPSPASLPYPHSADTKVFAPVTSSRLEGLDRKNGRYLTSGTTKKICIPNQRILILLLVEDVQVNFVYSLSGWCSTPTLLLICSSFSRENCHFFLICSSLSTAQL